jgi:hypothetical protein
VTTSFYQSHLAELHERLLGDAVVLSYLTGTGIRFDGAELSAADRFELPFAKSRRWRLRTCSPSSTAVAFTSRRRRSPAMTMPRLACSSR